MLFAVLLVRWSFSYGWYIKWIGTVLTTAKCINIIMKFYKMWNIVRKICNSNAQHTSVTNWIKSWINRVKGSPRLTFVTFIKLFLSRANLLCSWNRVPTITWNRQKFNSIYWRLWCLVQGCLDIPGLVRQKFYGIITDNKYKEESCWVSRSLGT